METRFPFKWNRLKKVHLGFEKKCLLIHRASGSSPGFLLFLFFLFMILNIRTKNVFDRIIMVGLHRKIFEIKPDIRMCIFTRITATHKFFNQLTGNFIHFNMAYRQYMAYRQHKQSCTWMVSRTWKISIIWDNILAWLCCFKNIKYTSCHKHV